MSTTITTERVTTERVTPITTDHHDEQCRGSHHRWRVVAFKLEVPVRLPRLREALGRIGYRCECGVEKESTVATTDGEYGLPNRSQ